MPPFAMLTLRSSGQLKPKASPLQQPLTLSLSSHSTFKYLTPMGACAATCPDGYYADLASTLDTENVSLPIH